MIKKGDKVGAVWKSNNEEVFLFGFGVMQGKEIPPPGISRGGVDFNKAGIEVEKILLGSGKVVWGCECYYAKEKGVRFSIGDRKVVEVDIDVERFIAKKDGVDVKQG